MASGVDIYFSDSVKDKYPNIEYGRVIRVLSDKSYKVTVSSRSKALTALALDGKKYSKNSNVLIGYPSGDKQRPYILGRSDLEIPEEEEVSIKDAPSAGGTFYIVDAGNLRVQVFDGSYNFLLKIEV